MLDLDLSLRTPGRVTLLERNHAQALLDRAFEERRAGQGGNLLTRAMGALAGLRPRVEARDDDHEIDRSRLAMPRVAWAGTVEWADGYAIVDGVAIIDISGVMTPDGYSPWAANRNVITIFECWSTT